jgi:hypothetical protein
LLGKDCGVSLLSPNRLKLRASSPLAQPASKIGSIRIATRFAEIPNCNPFFLQINPDRF